MANKILMPSGGQTTDEMIIQKWNKQVGDPVKRGDILFEIETDKAILTVESYAEGTLLEIRFPEGVMVKVGEVVAVIGKPGELTEEKSPVKENKKPEVTKEQVAEKKSSGQNGLVPAKSEGVNRILASPLAKSLAKVEKIDLAKVAEFVSGNLIKKADINRYIEQLSNKQEAPGNNDDADFYFVDNSQMRKTIARRMKESLGTAPHYVISVDVDMTAAIALRKKLNNARAETASKISFNDLIMKVTAKAISHVPLVNASFSESRLKVYRNVNIGLAVATETGILVPVVKAVNNKSIAEIAAENVKNIAKVKNNSLTESELQGGTITISNLGMFGIDRFTAIINQPESCILAIGSIAKKPVVKDDQIMIREMMNITGSFDHRIIDGAIGAPFLQKVKELLEDPELLLY